MSYGGTPRGGYQGGHFSEYQNNTPGSSGRKRYRDDDFGGGNDRGPQRRFNDYGSPRGRGRGRGGGFRGGRGGFRGGDRGDDLFDPAADEDRFCKQVWRLGDSERFDFRTEIPGIVRAVEDQWLRDSKPVFKAFRVAAVELPHKLPHYALILSMLATSRPKPRTLERTVHTATGVTTITEGGDQPGETESVSLGLEIVRDLVKSFQSHLDSRHWRSTRLTLSFFAHLASLPSPLVSPTSLVALLGSFAAAWEEVMGKAARGDECVRVVGEALLRSNLLASTEGRVEGVDAVLSSMKTYMASRKLERGLLNDDALAAQYDDPLEDLVASLESASPVTLLPTLAEPFAPELEARAAASSYPEPLELPTVLVPPDEDDEEGTAPVVGVNGNEAHANGTRGRRAGPRGPMTPDQKDRTGFGGATLSVQLFVDNSTPARQLPDGVLLRSLLGDLIDIFEVNRKEAARILLEAPKWVSRGTFRPRNQPVPPPPEQNANGDGEKTEGAEPEAPKPPMWSLENSVVEAVLTALFGLPFSPRRSIYYHSLVAELCRLSPATTAPALGKCVRRLYAGLGQLSIESEGGQRPASLEAEGIARLAEWFSVHLSNFGFMWGWKDWQDDLALPAAHPRRVFIARTLEMEGRLSYFDRIKGTVPETFVEAGVIAADAPAPAYEYESSDNEHHLAAADVMLLMRRKESTARLIEYLGKMKERLQNDPLCLTEAEADSRTRDVAVQVLLNIGSRSFSHFLNILERYIDLLRHLTGSTGSRLELLRIVAKFWRTNPQFCGIVIDKLLEYRVVDPIDVVAYVFEGDAADSPRDWSKMHGVDVLMSAVDTVKRRVKASKKKVATLKRTEENRKDALRAAEIKGDDVAMDDQDEPAQNEAKPEGGNWTNDEEVSAAEKVLESNRAEQDSVIADVVQRFDKALAIPETDGDEGKWARWWLLGWYKSFGRTFCTDLVRYGGALPALELAADGVGQMVLEQAQAWADFVGSQA